MLRSSVMSRKFATLVLATAFTFKSYSWNPSITCCFTFSSWNGVRLEAARTSSR